MPANVQVGSIAAAPGGIGSLLDPPSASSRPITSAAEIDLFKREVRRQTSGGRLILDYGQLQVVFDVAGDDMEQPDVMKKTYLQLLQYQRQVRLASPPAPPHAHLQLATACRGADGRQARRGFGRGRGHRGAAATSSASADGAAASAFVTSVSARGTTTAWCHE